MKAIAIEKSLIIANVDIEDTIFSLFYGIPYIREGLNINILTHDNTYCITTELEKDFEFLFFPNPESLIYYGDICPHMKAEWMREFIRGTLISARDIWENNRLPLCDFDIDDIFTKRRWRKGSALRGKAVILTKPKRLSTFLEKNSVNQDRDLMVIAFGLVDKEVTSSIFDKHSKVIGSLFDAYEIFRLVNIKSFSDATSTNCFPVVTSLKPIEYPAFYSFFQWLEVLKNTKQGDFIYSNIEKTQRIDGPAGSGKTLSLVLKCIKTVKDADDRGESHHSAFIVFSNETRDKIADSFFVPLDKEGYFQRERSESKTSIKITTLLNWAEDQLKDMVDTYSLPHHDPAVARRDQESIVRDVLEKDVPNLLQKFKKAISPKLSEICQNINHASVINMFKHEFGVIIKGIARGEHHTYLTINRPIISLPLESNSDRRFVYALYEKYQEELEEIGIVDLDDVSISHLKLLEMPLKRLTREQSAFNSVFVDEAHCFNPNELAVFTLLTKKAEYPPLVVAVDLPQGTGDKGYGEGGLDKIILSEFPVEFKDGLQKFQLEDIHRSSPEIINLAASIYTKGQNFFADIQLPSFLSSERPNGKSDNKPKLKAFDTARAMMDKIPSIVKRLCDSHGCRRSDILIVPFQNSLLDDLPSKLKASSIILQKDRDTENEQKAHRQNLTVIGFPQFLHGLEYEIVILLGINRETVPNLGNGAISRGPAALYATQQAVDELYLAITRARKVVYILYYGEPSNLLSDAVDQKLLLVEK